jgi:hypothetical protein
VPVRIPKYTLFSRPDVLEVLKVTAAQKARWAKLNEEHERSGDRLMEEINRNRRELDRQSFAAYMESIRPIQQALVDEADAIVVKVLDRAQRIRLNQIQLQAEGPIAFTRPEIQELLNLTPQQVELIGAFVEQGREEMRSASALPAGVMPSRVSRDLRRTLLESKAFQSELGKTRDAVVQARKSTMQQIAKVLTKGQRANYEKMVGEPFDFIKMETNRTSKPVRDAITKAN